jgi:hypothetical protein
MGWRSLMSRMSGKPWEKPEGYKIALLALGYPSKRLDLSSTLLRLARRRKDLQKSSVMKNSGVSVLMRSQQARTGIWNHDIIE